jgi:hypothetical protein
MNPLSARCGLAAHWRSWRPGVCSEAVAISQGQGVSLPLRQERSAAAAFEAPTGHVVVLGGESPDAAAPGALELVLPWGY